MKKVIALACAVILLGSNEVLAQRKSKKKKGEKHTEQLYVQPKLVVGIIVDQMRYDYLTRFWKDYGEGGFRRMIKDGFNFKNAHFNYKPTYTGPGHASVYTGTTPSDHGIIANNWFDKELGEEVYCAQDEAMQSVGTSSAAGKMSPHRMKTTTISDQLRLATQFRGKTIGISMKDRGSILPAGHTGEAYWFHGKSEGKFISSTFYMEQLPKWVADFNASGIANSYKKDWDLMKEASDYTESGSDDNNYEGKFNGEAAAVFPHKLAQIWDENSQFDIIKATPYGNSLTTDFAIAAIDGAELGLDMHTDMLAVSYSSTDYVGHQYGVNSVEIQDTYLRLDKDLERLFAVLDAKVGKGNYSMFLTADHAAVHVPNFLKDHKIPAGYLKGGEMKKRLMAFQKETFGSDELIRDVSNAQIFLNHRVIKNLDLELKEVQETFAMELMSYPNVHKVFTAYQMWQNDYTEGLARIIQNGYNQERSGDLMLVFDPGYISYPQVGSTHGSSFTYDTHVPILFYGKGIKKGASLKKVSITDIAPTMAALLGIAFPNGSTGKVRAEVLKK
ncbi:MAG: alkaline phosphatase family protein [Flavobacteriaceae bacterium]|nr:alkaline phosphatase family protein [Flavobacteriaceae bacterium]